MRVIDAHEMLRQARGLALDVTDGSSIVMKCRQAPGANMSSMSSTDVRNVLS